MSDLIVEVCEIKELKVHPGADLLEIAVVKGWDCIVKKGQYKAGDKVVYFPIDSVLPEELGDRLGVRNYLAGQKKNRVKCAKLRNEMSYGLIIDNEGGWEVGTSVSEHYRVTKYTPPPRFSAGDAAPEDPLFLKFTDIQNINNYPDVFENGETVIITEKIDGTSGRISFSKNSDSPAEWKAGSHRLKRKMPSPEEMPNNVYWFPYTVECVKNLIQNVFDNKEGIVCKNTCTLFVEIYGGKVRGGLKDLHYGRPNQLNFAAFAIQVDGKYIPWLVFHELCTKHNVPMVPVIGMMPFDIEYIKSICKGKSILAKDNGADHIMEGFVICAEKERDHPKCSRSILKMISPDYLLLKEKKADKGEVVDYTDM